ncbi:MAG: alpha/beta hydrolase [Pseudomonadota bacterium]
MRRFLTILLLLVLLVLGGGTAALWTPDTDVAEMKAKYGGPEALYAPAVGGMQVHYRVSGPVDAPAVVLIHGTSASLHTWEPLRATLENDYRVIAYDQPGHGLTGPHPDRLYTYDAMADGLDAVFAAEGINEAVLIGNSMGGWIAWRDAIARPDRVKALVLVDAAGIPQSFVERSNLGFRILQNPVGRLASTKLTPRAAIENSIYGTLSKHEVIDDAMVDRYWELLRYPGNRQAMADQFAGERADLSGRLKEVTVPTLVVFGDEDPLIHPSAADGFVDRMPNARAIIYEGVGHAPMEEIPALFGADVRAVLDDEVFPPVSMPEPMPLIEEEVEEADLGDAPLAPEPLPSDMP